MVAKEIHQSETVILRKIRVAGTWEGTQELCTFHSTFYVKLLKKLYTVWCQYISCWKRQTIEILKQLVIAKVFEFITGEHLIGEALVFILLRIVKLLNVILKWWIDEIIYLLPIKMHLWHFTSFQLLNRALYIKKF